MNRFGDKTGAVGLGILCWLLCAIVVASIVFPFFLGPGSIDRGSAIYNYGKFVSSHMGGYMLAGLISGVLGYFLTKHG